VAGETELGEAEFAFLVAFMSLLRNSWLTLALLIRALRFHANAQTVQFLPEIDAYDKLNPDLRMWFQVKETREGGDPTSAEIGPSLDFYLKPWIKLEDATAFDLDDSKTRPITFSVGYRSLPAAGGPSQQRFEPIITFNFPMNRADLDWKNGDFSWRYRNRVQFERTLTIHSYHPVPYASVEFFYESQYGKWSDTAIYAGCLFPIGKHFQFNPVLRAPEQYREKPESAVEPVGADA
jgi:hypothetical protein